MAPEHLLSRERWLWWGQLWSDVVMLAKRYRISPDKDWWDDGVKVEALAALAAWVARYDSGEWDDPPEGDRAARRARRVAQAGRGARADPDRRRHHRMVGCAAA